jgi:hypothetical protein
MHRSRLSVLVIFAAAAACSKRDDTEGNQILSQDRALVAQLELHKDARPTTLPDACGAITVAAHPSAANQQQAEELTRQADVAEMHGNLQEARALLLRASALDAMNKSTAYHLGRTNEALGDRTAAMAAYCRYLALAPSTAESVEARQRVADLSKSAKSVAAGTNGTSAPILLGAPIATKRRVPRGEKAPASRVDANGTTRRSTAAREPVRAPTSSSDATGGTEEPPPPIATETSSPNVSAAGTATADGDVAATPRPSPPADQPSTTSGSQRRTASGVQSTILGAAAGAIFGAATGRSVKSAVIGAAAGGVLGTVVGQATRHRTPGFGS